jgi:hypothetical protein
MKYRALKQGDKFKLLGGSSVFVRVHGGFAMDHGTFLGPIHRPGDGTNPLRSWTDEVNLIEEQVKQTNGGQGMQQLIEKLTEEGGFYDGDLLINDLQKAMWEFMKQQLAQRLEISVDKYYVGFFDSGSKITVKLKLDGEVISSDYVTVQG